MDATILPGPRASRVGGAIWLFIGLLLQGLTLRLFHLDFELLWPMILVMVGAWIVYRAVARTNPRNLATGDATDSFSVFSMMAGVERKSSSKAFRGGDATAIMGGCEIDLRDAQIADEGATIEVFAMWGGIEIMVPGDWSVAISATPVMGGVEDARKMVGSDPTKRLLIKGMVLMGGVEIRN